MQVLVLLLTFFLSPALSHATSITITGGTVLIGGGLTYQVNFSGLDEVGNVYQASSFTDGNVFFGAPGETLRYGIPMGANGALSINGQNVFPGGVGPPTAFFQIFSSGSVQLPDFVTPGPLTLVGPFALSGSITLVSSNFPNGFTSVQLNPAIGLAAVQVRGFSTNEYITGRIDAVYSSTLVPEPSSWLLLLSGLTLIFVMRRLTSPHA